ncbi:MAG: extracellular solute-binding protein [Anaerolineae bacterium]
MPENSTLTRQFLIVSLLLLVTIVTGGCDQLSQVLTPGPTQPETVTVESATITPLPTKPVPTPTPDIVALTLWTTEELGPVGQTPGQRRLSAQLAAFEAAHPGVIVDVVLKKPYGKGGMLDFLASTAVAVPAALPDVAILDVRELASAAQRDLIQPLDGLITPEVAQDLVAPARAAGQVNNTWFGLPFQADIQHLIYNTNLVRKEPVTWTDVLSGTAQYLFPAGGQAAVAGEGRLVNDAFVIQYFGTGARLTGESGQPALDKDALTAVLQFYAAGLAAGVIPLNAAEYTSVDDTWPIYLSEEAGLANVTSHRYLENREGFRKSSFAPVPTQKGTGTSIFRGWAYVLVSQPPERQEIAWSLIEWVTRPDKLGEWAIAANYLPTRLSAWPDNPEDEYLQFLAELLQVSQVRPTGSAHDEVGRALERAVQSIFNNTATPTEAADMAQASVP